MRGLTSQGPEDNLFFMSADRRAFVKSACLASLCACLGKDAMAAGPSSDTGAQADAPKPASTAQKWIAAVLPTLAVIDREQAKRILKSGAKSHYDALGMAAVVDQFRGKLDEFLDFPRKEWGWIVTHDRERGIIEIDENKPACVCPLLPRDPGAGLGVLCYCSEGFAERLFSEVTGAPVRAEVTASILRGQKSCKYRIELRPSGT